MKFVTTYILTAVIVIIKGQKLAPYRTVKCPLMLPFKHHIHTILLDLDGNSDVDLKTCIIENVYTNHSLLIISGSHTFTNGLLHNHKVTENPNVIILTKKITENVLKFPSIRRVIKSHRSQVYIIITDNAKFKCIDGVMNGTDFVSLQTFMNRLWHNYKIMRVVVAFPFSCKEKIAIYNGKSLTNNVLYDRNITLIDSRNNTYNNMQKSGKLLSEGYPLKADIFYRFPTSITECEKLHYYTKLNLNFSEGHCGLDGLMMHDVVKHFKFKLQFPKDDSCYNYGYVSPKNISGSLGCIIRNELDISFNSRFMTMYSEDNIYFLHYVTTDSLCALIKEAGRIPVWFYAISAYRRELCWMLISLIVVIGILTWIAATVKQKITGTKREKIFFYIKDAFTSMLFGFSSKKNGKLYLLTGTCLCSCILFSTICQSYINYMFTSLLRFDSIDKLDDLYQSENILYVSPSIRELLKQLRNPGNKHQNDFLMRSRLISANYSLGFVLTNPNTALIGRRNDAIMDVVSKYKDEYNHPTINIVDECFYTYYTSFTTRSGFPFYEEMQRFMQRLGEAGLPLIYYRWTYDMFGVPHSVPKIRREPRPFAKAKIDDVAVAFALLIFGYAISITVLIIEIVKYRHRTCVKAQ